VYGAKALVGLESAVLRSYASRVAVLDALVHRAIDRRKGTSRAAASLAAGRQIVFPRCDNYTFDNAIGKPARGSSSFGISSMSWRSTRAYSFCTLHFPGTVAASRPKGKPRRGGRTGFSHYRTAGDRGGLGGRPSPLVARNPGQVQSVDAEFTGAGTTRASSGLMSAFARH
jgi:hypothetical protein